MGQSRQLGTGLYDFKKSMILSQNEKFEDWRDFAFNAREKIIPLLMKKKTRAKLENISTRAMEIGTKYMRP